MHSDFHRNLVVEPTISGTVAGVTQILGNVVNHEGRLNVLHIVRLGAIVAGTISTVKVQHGSLANASDFVDVPGLTYTILDTDGFRFVRQELKRPSKPFSRVVVTRTTQNVTVEQAWAISNEQRYNPVAADATTVSQIVNV